MMVKRDVIEKVGPMPEEFFLYYEELDWSVQIRKKGYLIYYQPRAVVFHKGSVSVGKDSTLKTFYYNRNRILFMRRNVSRFQFFVFFLYMCAVSIPKTSLIYIFSGRMDHLRAFWRALFWHLGRLS